MHDIKHTQTGYLSAYDVEIRIRKKVIAKKNRLISKKLCHEQSLIRRKQYLKNYQMTHREQINASGRAYRLKNRDRINARERELYKSKLRHCVHVGKYIVSSSGFGYILICTKCRAILMKGTF